ncbi:hypothetical protein DPMN_044065 [Dreissena polymorpha]|uniref:Uncharacterized protein n=1 Tax=Dreissena polymorpha TaxID=45954 RepID=A0A9D4D3H5_DREPO|nr:hypothetical protein DPMN_044065 [Dreissena polymorpha]
MFPRAGARSVGVLTPMFGITWLIGVFAVNDTTSVFQWLFVILNSLQVTAAYDGIIALPACVVSFFV